MRRTRSSRHRSAGFTLIELVAALAITSVLLGGMVSAVLLTSHALPDPTALAERTADAMTAAEWITGDVVVATTLVQADSSAVEFIVPDRGHDDAGPETIRYSWSGTVGDPLVRQYNGGAAVALYDDVHDFTLEYVRKAKPLSAMPRVLLIVADDVAPNAQDQARRTQLESWGFQVDILDPSAGDAAYTTALADANVMYWSEEHATPPPGWVFDAPTGIVCEKQDSLSTLGISKSANWHWFSVLQIVDNTHEITRPFPLGPITVFSSDQYGIISTQLTAPGGTILGNNSGYDIMVAVDFGSTLWDGRTAPARRVSMPWGDRDFDFYSVTTDGLVLMRRAITWAAAPVGVSVVRISLQLGSDPSGRVETQVQLLNLPEAS